MVFFLNSIVLAMFPENPNSPLVSSCTHKKENKITGARHESIIKALSIITLYYTLIEHSMEGLSRITLYHTLASSDRCTMESLSLITL